MAPRVTRSRLADTATVVVAAMAFATSSPLARVAVGLSPIVVAAGRTLVASVAIFAAKPRVCIAALRALTGKQALALAGVGALLAVHFALFLLGLATTSFPAAVALVSLEPLSVVLCAWVAFGLRPTRQEGAGVLLATVGAFVVSSGAGQGEHRLLGDGLVLGAVVLYGVYVASARGLREIMPGLPYAGSVYAVATLTLALPSALLLRDQPPPPPSSVAAVVALGLVPTLVGHTLVQIASRHSAPAVVALVSPGETLGSLAIGAALLHAWPSSRESLGALLVLAGATLAILGGARPRVTPLGTLPR